MNVLNWRGPHAILITAKFQMHQNFVFFKTILCAAANWKQNLSVRERELYKMLKLLQGISLRQLSVLFEIFCPEARCHLSLLHLKVFCKQFNIWPQVVTIKRRKDWKLRNLRTASTVKRVEKNTYFLKLSGTSKRKSELRDSLFIMKTLTQEKYSSPRN